MKIKKLDWAICLALTTLSHGSKIQIIPRKKKKTRRIIFLLQEGAELSFESELSHRSNMGFLITTLIFVVVGIIASLCVRICFARGPSTNLLHFTLVITATVCCWMMWAIVYIAQMNPLIVPILSEVE